MVRSGFVSGAGEIDGVRTSIEATFGGAGAASFLAKAKTDDTIISDSPSVFAKLNAVLVMHISFTCSATFSSYL